jgi:chemotaxis protein methyltransferase CheR
MMQMPQPPLSAPDLAPRTLSVEEFRLFQDLIYREAGIHLSDAKRALLVGRLSPRLRVLRLRTFRDYHRHVTRVDPAERVTMLDCITTNETRFFREPQQFGFVEEQLVPAWKAEASAGARQRRIRVWSAACSTGEEPYSLAMTLLSHFPRESGWTVEILASDISTRVLNKAREGVWPLERTGEIPERFMKRYMVRNSGDRAGTARAGQEIRSAVKFERINLSKEPYPAGPFDLIFCRNVLIYFDGASKNHVIGQLTQRLAPGGCLFLGHAESILGVSTNLRRVGPTIYAPAA